MKLTIVMQLFSANPAHSFCGQDEDHDPNVEFEECLDCIVCGNIGKSLARGRKRKSANINH